MAFIDEVSRDFYQLIEEKFIESVKDLEGGVIPPNEEITLFAQKVSYPDGKLEIYWKGKRIILIEPQFDRYYTKRQYTKDFTQFKP